MKIGTELPTDTMRAALSTPSRGAVRVNRQIHVLFEQASVVLTNIRAVLDEHTVSAVKTALEDRDTELSGALDAIKDMCELLDPAGSFPDFSDVT